MLDAPAKVLQSASKHIKYTQASHVHEYAPVLLTSTSSKQYGRLRTFVPYAYVYISCYSYTDRTDNNIPLFQKRLWCLVSLLYVYMYIRTAAVRVCVLLCLCACLTLRHRCGCRCCCCRRRLAFAARYCLRRNLTEDEARFFAAEITLGLEFLHSKGACGSDAN